MVFYVLMDLSPLPITQLAQGFITSKALAVAVELDIFGQLTGGPGRTKDDLVARLGVSERGADMLLALCASVGLVESVDGRFRNTPLADEYLVPDRPYYLGAVVRALHERSYPLYQRLADAVRTGRPVTYDPDAQESVFASPDPAMLNLFWDGLHALSSLTARALATAYDFSPHRRLLDVGGGSGAFPIELCRRYPELTATVLDLPFVCPIAERKAGDAGLGDRVAAVVGDFRADPALPDGHDLILLSLILHDWDEATNRDLLAKCHAALPPDGALVVCEHVLDDERTGPPGAAQMGLAMLAETPGGRNYSHAEYRGWLVDSGFTRIEAVPLPDAPGASHAIIAYR